MCHILQGEPGNFYSSVALQLFCNEDFVHEQLPGGDICQQSMDQVLQQRGKYLFSKKGLVDFQKKKKPEPVDWALMLEK